MSRTLALCGCDFGRAPEVSANILKLARGGRLNAVSCLVNGASWLTDAAALQGLPAAVHLGLQFNLSEGRPLSPRLARLWPRLPALPWLVLRAHLGLLPRGALRGEFHAQLRAFGDATGAPPAYIDGHRHVHALPRVRELLLDAAEHMRPVPAVRSSARVLGPGEALRRGAIEWLGGRGLGRELVQRELAHNPALLGIHAAGTADYRALMRGWLAEVPPEGALLRCHPGAAYELAYLEGAAFAQDLADAGVVLGPVWRLRARPQG
jgi:predicted glycoside hydrolase/deacetylase ChbG (UPF0249 family)